MKFIQALFINWVNRRFFFFLLFSSVLKSIERITKCTMKKQIHRRTLEHQIWMKNWVKSNTFFLIKPEHWHVTKWFSNNVRSVEFVTGKKAKEIRRKETFFSSFSALETRVNSTVTHCCRILPNTSVIFLLLLLKNRFEKKIFVLLFFLGNSWCYSRIFNSFSDVSHSGDWKYGKRCLFTIDCHLSSVVTW